MFWNAKSGTVPAGGSIMDYVRFGHGEKSFVLLPGLSDGLAAVRGKALLLAPPYRKFFDRYTVYMFSRKRDLPRGTSVENMADDQAEAMASLGMKNAAVMGVSQGGMIAQVLAVRHPELVGKLVIAVSAPRVNDTIRECVGAWISFAEAGDHKGLMISTAERSYSEAYLKKYRRLYPVLGAVGKPRDNGRFLANAEAILRFDALGEIGRIACPAMIIGGAEDRIVGIDASYEMHGRIGGSELFIYPGLGHAAYEEAPDFNDRVFCFLENGS